MLGTDAAVDSRVDVELVDVDVAGLERLAEDRRGRVACNGKFSVFVTWAPNAGAANANAAVSTAVTPSNLLILPPPVLVASAISLVVSTTYSPNSPPFRHYDARFGRAIGRAPYLLIGLLP